MGSINVDFALDITVDGQYVGLSCHNVWNMSCCAERGTWNIVYYQGSVMPLAPSSTSIPFDGEGGNEGPKVFCDPCKNLCTKDGNPLKYGGDQKWLFEVYVNSSPEPQPIYLAQFTVSKSWDYTPMFGDCGTPPWEDMIQDKTIHDILTIGDQSVCCGAEEPVTYYMEPVAKELKDLLPAFKQPVINFNGDPSEACLCGCPGFCGPSADNDCAGLAQILGIWRDYESNNCVIDG